MRCTRMRMSCSVLFSACPRCSAAVTLGGGMTMQYGSPGSVGSAWKARRSFHRRSISVSIDFGSYDFGSSVVVAMTQSRNGCGDKSRAAVEFYFSRIGIVRGWGRADNEPATLSYDDWN